MPAIAESVCPEGEKSSACRERSLSLRSSFAAVASHDAFCSGSEILIWFLDPSARISPPSPQAPHVMAPLCLPAKCLREMNVSLEADVRHKRKEANIRQTIGIWAARRERSDTQANNLRCWVAGQG